eukprot:scaffold44577_cov51-Phaeocystis_antarctica.AAC.3
MLATKGVRALLVGSGFVEEKDALNAESADVATVQAGLEGLQALQAQGSLPRGQALLYVRRTRTSLGRAVRTAYRGISGHQGYAGGGAEGGEHGGAQRAAQGEPREPRDHDEAARRRRDHAQGARLEGAGDPGPDPGPDPFPPTTDPDPDPDPDPDRLEGAGDPHRPWLLPTDH